MSSSSSSSSQANSANSQSSSPVGSSGSRSANSQSSSPVGSGSPSAGTSLADVGAPGSTAAASRERLSDIGSAEDIDDQTAAVSAVTSTASPGVGSATFVTVTPRAGTVSALYR
ncbi:hypothetical protein ANCCAN_17198 [Ancylostoma caninum]|uniref:Uncharacterized protein n=1 Tax=Ancylostoma caninum TaxID=29170 RepID=A0A368FXR9_ANCCA|nr:hypothetical protein ANCCAN_17198 [Ancylostoma caninum]